jgi:hypothetical protein
MKFIDKIKEKYNNRENSILISGGLIPRRSAAVKKDSIK